jgi:hypothetical protein
VIIGTAWAAGVALGWSRLWAYESTPNVAARAVDSWPAGARVERAAGLPTLVMLAHPKCPCSRATVGELAKLMTDCGGKLRAVVLMVRPAGEPVGWERTDLWKSAAEIPGVIVVSDDDGVEARRFGAATSGQVVLYSAEGKLLFAGGITESRGHAGDNAGRSAIAELVGGGGASAGVVRTPVYGCPLFDEGSRCLKEGKQACQIQ